MPTAQFVWLNTVSAGQARNILQARIDAGKTINLFDLNTHGSHGYELNWIET